MSPVPAWLASEIKPTKPDQEGGFLHLCNAMSGADPSWWSQSLRWVGGTAAPPTHRIRYSVPSTDIRCASKVEGRGEVRGLDARHAPWVCPDVLANPVDLGLGTQDCRFLQS